MSSDNFNKPLEQIQFEDEQWELLRKFEKEGDLESFLKMDHDQELGSISAEWVYNDFAENFMYMVICFQSKGKLKSDLERNRWRIFAAHLQIQYSGNHKKCADLFTHYLMKECAIHNTRSLYNEIHSHVLGRFEGNGMCGICESDSKNSLYQQSEPETGNID